MVYAYYLTFVNCNLHIGSVELRSIYFLCFMIVLRWSAFRYRLLPYIKYYFMYLKADHRRTYMVYTRIVCRLIVMYKTYRVRFMTAKIK